MQHMWWVFSTPYSTVFNNKYALKWNHALSGKANSPTHKPFLLKNHVVDCSITTQLATNKTETRQ